ncbi:glycoside hydrolase family 3 N-terminal domain-containing protein [Hirschia litorea]|uniref:Glycoside hydrolase family 3 N-terminal domain-containing protein n=1 Tax=Hirschia litorea TaxID=1199156 RepID=A0ABW2IMV7_9PROT
MLWKNAIQSTICLVALTACTSLTTQAPTTPAALANQAADTSLADAKLAATSCLSERAQNLLKVMTIEEKIGQLHQAAGGRSKNLNSKLTPEELDKVRRGEVGSYLHVAGAKALGELQKVATEESKHGIPLLFAMDVVHGYRTIFPVPIAMASTWDTEQWHTASRIAAQEATAAGLHWTFAPMVDIARDPRWGRIVEGAGADPYLGSRMAAAQVEGFQNNDLSASDTLLATTKHLGVYGAPTGGRDYGSSDVSERTLNEVYLPPFYAANVSGSGSYMTAFNDIGGIPSTANEEIVDGILREDWGFCGLVVSDWNAIHELINHGVAKDRPAAAALALKAGVDMDMTSAVYKEDLVKAIENDPSLMMDLDLAAGRVITVKEQLGLFDNAAKYHDEAREKAQMLTPASREAARIAAEKSAVLLKNDNNAFPIASGPQKIAVLGALATDSLTQLGSWRGRGDANDVVSILDGLKTHAPEGIDISYSETAENISDFTENADRILLVIGEDYDLSGEARSRSDIELPADQTALFKAAIETGKPVSVILVTGRALAIPEIDQDADAILNIWMGGVEAGNAVANLVYGTSAPAGRLPISFPRKTGQAPLTYSEYPSGRPADPDLSNDSNRFIDLPITPLYPFGHGLSYSTFEYSNLSAAQTEISADGVISLSVTVTNTGDITADEVVQLYMRDPVAFVARPQIQLRGFKRVTLEPDQSATVTFELSPQQAAIYKGRNDWKVESGDLEFFIGGSSADLKSSQIINILNNADSKAPAAALETKVSVTQ